jgi:MinD-like ATPase involved in chromosome partitioning or flagellar assembly
VASPAPHAPQVPTAGDLLGREAGRSGQLVAVWGPTGAPGRTTVAVTLAAELAVVGLSTLIADADTYGPSVAQTLALLDESAGLAAAVRAANQGVLDVARLARLAPVAQPGLRVLTGIPRPGRWTELRPSGLQLVWRTARDLVAWTVVDCGFGLESDEEVSFDVTGPRRNGATLCTLAEADLVLVVGTADPIGLQRLVRGLQELREVLGPAVAHRVVVTRVRESAVGSSPQRKVSDALARYAGVHDLVLVPDDRPACDAAMLAGRSITEVAPQSPARRALAQLATELHGGVRVVSRAPGRSSRRPVGRAQVAGQARLR